MTISNISTAQLWKGMHDSMLLKQAMHSHSPDRVLPSSPQLCLQSQYQSQPHVAPIEDLNSAPSAQPHTSPHAPSLSPFCELCTATGSPLTNTGIYLYNAVPIISPLTSMRSIGSSVTLGLLVASSRSAATSTDGDSRSVGFITGPDVLISPGKEVELGNPSSKNGSMRNRSTMMVKKGSRLRRQRHRSPTPFMCRRSDSSACSGTNKDASLQARTPDHRRTSSSDRRGYCQKEDAGNWQPVQKLSSSASSTVPSTMCMRSSNQDLSTRGHGHGRKGGAVARNNSGPRTKEMRVGPVLDRRKMSKVVSFSIQDESDMDSPTSIQRMPTARRIRRDVTPFSPRVGMRESKDDENSLESNSSTSNTAIAIVQGPRTGENIEVDTDGSIIQQRQALVMRIRERSAEKARVLNAQMAASEAATTVAAGVHETKEKKVVHPDE